MKRKKGHLVLLGVTILCATLATKKNNHDKSVSKKQDTYVSVDPLISDQKASEIKEYIQQNPNQSQKNDGFKELLVKRFPFISTISIKTSPDSISYFVYADTPVINVNGDCTITEQGTIVEKEVFIAQAYESLPTITMPYLKLFEQIPTQRIVSIIRNIPAVLFDDYSLVFEHPTCAFLYDKTAHSFAIAFNPLVPLHQTMIDRCISLKKEIENRNIRNATTCKKKALCFADVRFDNRIIMRSEMGRRRYG